jgi:hypothetical protein
MECRNYRDPMKSRRARRTRHTRGRGRRGGGCVGKDAYNGPGSNGTLAICGPSNQGNMQGSMRCSKDNDGNCKWVDTSQGGNYNQQDLTSAGINPY